MTALTERAVTVARAALAEAGRPDLAADVYPYGEGWPSHELLGCWCATGQHHGTDDDLLIKAFTLGHQAAGHPVHVYFDPKCGHTHLLWPVTA